MNSLLKSIFKLDCYMLDIESTGLDIYRNGITSFALVKFDLTQPNFLDVVSNVIHCKIHSGLNANLRIAYDNNDWRKEHNIDEHERVIDSLNTIRFFTDLELLLADNLLSYNNNNHLFALHPEFDVAFILKYFKYLNVDFPFHHRNVWDVASMAAGVGKSFQEMRTYLEQENLMLRVPRTVKVEHFRPHNAVYDCMIQIYTLWYILNK